MKRTLVLFLAICLFMLPLTQPGVYASSFPDVPETHPNYGAVIRLAAKGIVSGYDDGTFRPEREITRTEFCALMARAFGIDKETYEVKELPFSDVNEDYWGIAFISFCYENGFINGMGDGTFAPAANVTVAQAVKMAVCAIGKEAEVNTEDGNSWYSGYMRTAEKYEIVKGVVQTPEENTQRSNAAQLIYNVITFGQDEEPLPAPEDESITYDDVIQFGNEGFEGFESIDAVFEQKDYSEVNVIVIDPGHNYSGKDIGARIDALGIREEIITWQIADKLRYKLQELGYTVYMTRDNLEDSIANTSSTESLQARVDLSHQVMADLYISIHCNMGGGTGAETYCFSLDGYAARLAKLIQKKISEATGFYNRGVKTANFFVIKNTAMPSVLVETGFLDTESDRELLTSDEGQELIAQAIADAVAEYDAMPPLSW